MRRVSASLALCLLLLPKLPTLASDQQLAYVKDNDIYLAYLDGSDPLRLTRDPDNPKSGLVWSFDGECLAYVRMRQEGKTKIADLYMISVKVPKPCLVVDGAKLRPMGSQGEYRGAWSPAFDPGGQFLYFLSGGNAEGSELWRADLKAASLPVVPEQVKTNKALRSVAFASDGRVAGCYAAAYPEGGRHLELCVAPAGKWEEFADISEPTGTDDPGDDYIRPAWSPDGKTIAAIQTRRDDVCLFHPAEGHSELLVDGDARDGVDITEVTWRPDGAGIFFVVTDIKSGKPHSAWYAPLSEPYDREMIARGVHSLAAGGSVKLRIAKAS